MKTPEKIQKKIFVCILPIIAKNATPRSAVQSVPFSLNNDKKFKLLEYLCL